MMEEIDVAALCQCVGERDIVVADAVVLENLATQTIRIFPIPLAVKFRTRVDHFIVDQSKRQQRFDDRTWRNRHLGHAIEQRAMLIANEFVGGWRSYGERVGIKARRASRD